jgi:hypothetical protein
MAHKFPLQSAALVGVALLTSSSLFAQQHSPPGPAALEEAAEPAAGTLGVNTKTYSALVNADGTLALGPAGSNSLHGGLGLYEVFFPSDVSKCVYAATVGEVPGVPGIATATEVAVNPNGVFVVTYGVNGAPQNHPFHLLVQC